MKNLIDELHTIKLYGRSLSHFRKMGNDCNYGEIIKVKSSDLCLDSRIVVKCICSECSKIFEIPFCQFIRMKESTVCSSKCRTIQTKRVIIERYRTDNISKLDSVKTNKKNKAQEKYGVDNISQSSIIKRKKVNTSIKHYGVDNISKSDVIKQKKIETCRKNYGVDYPSQSKIVLDKYVKTIQKKYGIEFTNISQVSEIMDKKLLTGICAKKYVLPSGRIVKIQGYENYGIEYLLNAGILENDIVVGNKEIENEIGLFWFYDSKKNKNCRYFPDIYVRSKHKIYEVKSTYTINLNANLINMKKQSIIAKGFDFEFLVFNNKGIKS